MFALHSSHALSARLLLLVEDNLDHAELVHKAVASLGTPWTLMHCKTGSQALDLIERADFDFSLGVIDLGLPDLGGAGRDQGLAQTFQ